MKIFKLVLGICIVTFGLSCSKDGDVNFFSKNDDIAFGKQLDSTILADPTEYPILNEAQNPEVYAYVRGIMNTVLQSNEVLYKEEFPWQIRVIDKDVLNAFAAPGGYLYFYTGFIKYCRSEAEFAGVMAHEIAHADRRHSTETLTKVYGIQILFSILLGDNPSQLQEIAALLATNGAALSFSRKHEYEADEYSLRYLNSIKQTRNYHPTAIIDFFDHMKEDSLTTPDGSFEFLRTHPYDNNRKANVQKIWQELGSPVGSKFETEHAAIVAKLD